MSYWCPKNLQVDTSCVFATAHQSIILRWAKHLFAAACDQVARPTPTAMDTPLAGVLVDRFDAGVGASRAADVSVTPPQRWGKEVFDIIEWRRFEAVVETCSAKPASKRSRRRMALTADSTSGCIRAIRAAPR